MTLRSGAAGWSTIAAFYHRDVALGSASTPKEIVAPIKSFGRRVRLTQRMTQERLSDPALAPPSGPAAGLVGPRAPVAGRFLARHYERVFRDVLTAFGASPATVDAFVDAHAYGLREPSALLFAWSPMEHVAGALLTPEFEDLRLARNEKLRAIAALARALERAYPAGVSSVEAVKALRDALPEIRHASQTAGGRLRRQP